MSPTPQQVALWGPRKDFFAVDDWCAAIRWLVLGGLCKACLRLHKIGQSPTRRFSKTSSQLVGVLALKEACRHSCRAPVEDGLRIHNAIGHWAYQVKKEEEDQLHLVLFVTEN